MTHDPKADEYALITLETRPWQGEVEQLKQLQTKVNNYLHFALDGELVQKYPQAVGKPVRIQLDCESEPAGETADFLNRVGDAVRRQGLGFVINVL